MFVNSEAAEFLEFLQALGRLRPDARLTHLDPAAALQQMGVMSAGTVVKSVVGLLIGIPILAAVLAQIFR